MSAAVALALAGCGSGTKPRAPIAAFNECVRGSSAGLGTSEAPTGRGFERIYRNSDSLSIGTVFLFDSRHQAQEFASLSKGYPDQFVAARSRYMVGVYSMLPKRYVTAIAACVGKLPA